MFKRVVILTIILSIILIENLSACGPAGHYVILEKVLKDLPTDSAIKQAIKKYPEIAAAGALGPDINYAEYPLTRGSYAPWVDRYHYDRVGSMAGGMLKLALSKHDEKWIAFAAGWLTHVIGDMSFHGIYINPEAGVYMDSISGRNQHMLLEKNAEPFMWIRVGKHSGKSWSESCYKLVRNLFIDNFCSADQIPYDLIDISSYKIWGRHPGNDFRSWYRNFLLGLNLGIGYKYIKLNDALKVLNINDRKNRITKAIDMAINDTVSLMCDAENNDYSRFSDSWNLGAIDCKYDHRPIGTLVVSIKTAKKLGAGSNADIYFGLTNSNGACKQWLIEKKCIMTWNGTATMITTFILKIHTLQLIV